MSGAAFAGSAHAAGSLAVGPGGDVAVLSATPRPLVGALAGPDGAFGGFTRLRGGRVQSQQVVVNERGEAVAAWESSDGVMVAVAPPGGRFGRPRAIGGRFSGYPALAAGPDGEVLLAWTEDGVQVATRPAGGEFGAPVQVAAGGAVRGLGIDSRGTAVLMLAVPGRDDRSSEYDIRVSERPRGGAFSEPVVIAGAASGAGSGGTLAVAPNGRALAVWSVDDRLVGAQRPPGGPFGAPVPVSDRPCGDSVGPDSAGVSDDGYALVAFNQYGNGDYGEESGDGCINGSKVVETLPDGSFSRPIDVSRPTAPAYGASVAVDGAGHATVGFGHPRFRASVRYRAPGGQLGQPIDLAGPRRGGYPAVALAPDGSGLAAWSENGGERIRLRLRPFAADGATAPARTLRSLPAYERGRRSACLPPGSKTVLRTQTSRVFTKKPGRITKYACFFPRGEPLALDCCFSDFPVTSTGPPAMALNGPLVATIIDDPVCGVCAGYTALEVVDLRTGETANGYAPGGAPDPYSAEIYRMVLTRGASVAWTDRSRVWAFPAGTVRPKVIDRSRGLEPKSLRLRGQRLTWRRGGRLRSATLAP